MDILMNFQDWFFTERFWLPGNTTWNELRNIPGDHTYIPQAYELTLIFPAAAGLFIIRKLFETLVAAPVGRSYGLSDKKVTAVPNAALENLYKQSQYPERQSIEALTKQTDLSDKQIQRWLRRRRNQDRSTRLTKFTETAWRCFYYLAIFIYGLCVVSQESWFWDVKDCFRGYPRQHVKPAVFWYYIIELGFYLSLLFSQFVDVKRKDFWEQFVHHIATITLMAGSFTANYTRIGALILCLHDASDILLESAKLARYVEKRTLCDALFGIFTISWAVTRLTIFPYVIIWSAVFDSREQSGSSPFLVILNGLLIVLLILHIFWFCSIMTVLIKALQYGKVDKDVRSASEESCEEDANTMNGAGQHS
ncbi:ceramide synthase 5-like [Watersipora subatra]|uniref:ceramide synthase 5-like n=1 Tax=Watersipora subatra TaxID=2589382 RepID=UPI00355AF6C7